MASPDDITRPPIDEEHRYDNAPGAKGTLKKIGRFFKSLVPSRGAQPANRPRSSHEDMERSTGGER
jgi:hypothetical protein